MHLLRTTTTLLIALSLSVSSNARDMTREEFVSCSHSLTELKDLQQQHQQEYEQPRQNHLQTTEALSVLRDSVEGELRTLTGQRRAGVPLPDTTLEDLRLARQSLDTLQRHYQSQAENLQRQLAQSKDRLIARQNAFRSQCLSGIKVPKSVFKELCSDNPDYALCSLFKK